MTLSQILFSFEGRINRAKYWGYGVLIVVVMLIALAIDFAITGQAGVFYLIVSVVTFWPDIAIAVKRCHDRDRSGWFVLVSLIPIVNLWYIVEIGFLKGTTGSNRFGPDPLEAVATPQPATTE